MEWLPFCRLLGQKHDAWKEYNTAIALAEHAANLQILNSTKVCLCSQNLYDIAPMLLFRKSRPTC